MHPFLIGLKGLLQDTWEKIPSNLIHLQIFGRENATLFFLLHPLKFVLKNTRKIRLRENGVKNATLDMLEKLQKQTKHSTICHVKKKDPKKELQKEAWLERKEKALPTYSISCDSIYISHSVKDMIVPTFVRSGIFPSLFNLLLWHSLATLLTFL